MFHTTGLPGFMKTSAYFLTNLCMGDANSSEESSKN